MAKQSTDRRDLYQEITNRIVVDLERGIFPWARPWKSLKETPEAQPVAFFSMPRNAVTGRLYSGINTLLLWMAKDENGFAQNHWLTFKQAISLGGAVRKGEKGTLVVYADKFIPKEERAKAREESRETRPIFFLKGFTVFNISQCDGLPETVGAVVKPKPAEVPERSAAIVKASRVDLRIGGDKAYYTPQGDFIGMPHPAQFKERVEFDRTLFHELCHWSGHKTRLNRDLANRFGSQGYAREELVAEIGSAYVAAAMGIEPTVRHADYLNSWLKCLKEDKRAIVQAASQASKAADFILAFEDGRYAETVEEMDEAA